MGEEPLLFRSLPTWGSVRDTEPTSELILADADSDMLAGIDTDVHTVLTDG